MPITPKPQKRMVQTPAGLFEAEVKTPIANLNFPKGPCPLVNGPCCQDQEECGFWTETLGVEQTILMTQKPVIIGSCIFYATMNIAMSPRAIAVQDQPPGGGRDTRHPAQ